MGKVATQPLASLVPSKEEITSGHITRSVHMIFLHLHELQKKKSTAVGFFHAHVYRKKKQMPYNIHKSTIQVMRLCSHFDFLLALGTTRTTRIMLPRCLHLGPRDGRGYSVTFDKTLFITFDLPRARR